jgi:hypothetical protein
MMTELPQPSRRTGIYILALGILITITGETLRFLLESSTIEVSLTMVRMLYDLSILFSSDVGPGIVAWGIGWLIASYRRFERSYLYVVVAGIFVMTTTFTLMRWNIVESPFLDFQGLLFLYSLFYAVGPMLLASGVVAGVFVEQQRQLSGGPDIIPSKDVTLVSLLVASLFFPYLAVMTPNWWLLLWVCVIWVVWHVFAPLLANAVVLGFRPSKRAETRREYELRFKREPAFEHLTFTSILSKAYVPTAFGLGATFTLYRFLKLTPFYIPFTPGPFGTVADTTSYAIWAIALGALFVGPVVWLLNDAEISLVHRHKSKIKIPAVHGFLIGMTKLYGFVLGPFLFVFLETERDYLLTFTLLPLMLYTIFMVSLAATLLYFVLSRKRCMSHFLESLSKESTPIEK